MPAPRLNDEENKNREESGDKLRDRERESQFEQHTKVADNGKPTIRRKRSPKPKTLFDRRLLKLERDINKLYRLLCDFKTQYINPKPKRSRKNSEKDNKST